MAEKNEKYVRAINLADTVIAQIGKLLSTALEEIGNPALVKAVLDKPRVKPLSSISRKAQERGWSIDDAIEKCWDFVGFRVICNNLQDVERAADLFEQALIKNGFEPTRNDYITKPQSSGYRAIHLHFPVGLRFGKQDMTLHCELQLRTRLQDAWGHLSREEMYRKQVPEDLVERMKDLSETLSKADGIAEDIRRRVSAPRKGQKPDPGAPLTATALAFIYERAFGQQAPDYVIETAVDEIGKRNIRADALDATLNDHKLIEQLSLAYEEKTNWSIYPEVLFDLAIRALISGKRSAITIARKRGKQDWEEVDSVYKGELASSVPDTWSELREELEKDDADLYSLAKYFDAADKCARCGQEIFQFDSLAQEIVDFYRLKDKKADEACDLVQRTLQATDMDDADGGSLCGYCSYVLEKDD
jgi:ppGpp synthetase/RelA/SpoT-type nucleotidyltranferase